MWSGADPGFSNERGGGGVVQKIMCASAYPEREVVRSPLRDARALLTHSEWRPQNIYSQEEINLYGIIKLATSISLFSLQISQKLDVLCRQNKIWTFCQFEDSQIISPKIIPIYEPSQYLTVTKLRAHSLLKIFLFLLVHNSEFLRKSNQSLDALSCYLRFMLKHSDSKRDTKKSIKI